jgi:hypothetical protein
MSRQFTAKKNGVVVRRGTFHNEQLLYIDFPSPEYELLLDQYLDFPQVVHTYAEMRALEYPSAGVLADAMYWQAKGDSTKMEAYLAACEAVKRKYPKS